MQRSSRELWFAFIAILIITAVYAWVVILLDGIPHSSDLFGHLIGVVGFIMMIMTETLYTLRKRSRKARWGRTSSWLEFHIFTGIVGPYMVLLHSAWRFQGLAGVTMLLTVLIVISGFVGRYIYTAVPRTLDGVEIEAGQLEAQIIAAQAELQAWLAGQPDSVQRLYGSLLNDLNPPASETRLVFGRSWLGFFQRLRWRKALRGIEPSIRKPAVQLEQMLRRQQLLRNQVASLAVTRRWLGLWHTIHIPIGTALFTAAIVHTIAAFYYATLLR
jgi:hypothetical protein